MSRLIRQPPVLPAKNPPKQPPKQSLPNPPPTNSNSDAYQPTSQDVAVVFNTELPELGPTYLKSAKMYRIRDKVAHEILTTEKSYVESLNVLCDVWHQELKKSEVVTSEDLETLFSNIGLLRNFNQEFLLVLEERLSRWEDSTTIADVFVRFAPFFKMYTQYVLNHDRAGTLLSDLNKVSRFQRICEAICKDAKVKGLELASYLIMPIQRIPRYKLLLTELQKNTPKQHGDMQYLDSALDTIGKVAMEVNDAFKSHENRTQMINIQRQFIGDVDIVVPFRSFVRKGPLIKKCRSTDIEYEFILFNDLLLYASVTVAKSYKLHRKLPINKSFFIQDLRDDGMDKNRFQIVTTDKSFIVLVATPELKQAWLNDLYRCIAEQKLRISSHKEANSDVAPVWQADSTSTNCSCCNTQFSFLKRRHHCRKCGALVCNDCSKERVVLKANDEPKRICDTCVRTNRPITSSSSIRPEESITRNSDSSFLDLPPSPMAEHSRMDSISEFSPALNAIAEDDGQGEEKESDIPPPPPLEEESSMDRNFPTYISTEPSTLTGVFALKFNTGATIRAYVYDSDLNIALGKLETDNSCQIGIFSMNQVQMKPNQPKLKDYGYFITASATEQDFAHVNYIDDELLMRYEPGHVLLVAKSDWEKADDKNPWVNAFNATTRVEGCIPCSMQNKVLYSLSVFRDGVSSATSTTFRPSPMVPNRPTASLRDVPSQEPPRQSRISINQTLPEPPAVNHNLPVPPTTMPSIPKKPSSALRQADSSESTAPQAVVGTKPEGQGHCGMHDCLCDKFIPNQFRKTICLTCRHNLSFHTV